MVELTTRVEGNSIKSTTYYSIYPCSVHSPPVLEGGAGVPPGGGIVLQMGATWFRVGAVTVLQAGLPDWPRFRGRWTSGRLVED